jgi:hypothetical protein
VADIHSYSLSSSWSQIQKRCSTFFKPLVTAIRSAARSVRLCVCFLAKGFYMFTVSLWLSSNLYSILYGVGEQHNRHRKIMSPAFTAPQLKSFLALFQHHAGRVKRCFYIARSIQLTYS